MTAKDYLQQYANLDREIEGIWEYIQRLRSLSTRSTVSMSGLPGQKMKKTEAMFENIILNLMTEEAKMNTRIDRLVRMRDGVDRILQGVPDLRYRKLLELRYLKGMTMEQVAEAMHYSRRNIFYLHKQALQTTEDIVVEDVPLMA